MTGDLMSQMCRTNLKYSLIQLISMLVVSSMLTACKVNQPQVPQRDEVSSNEMGMTSQASEDMTVFLPMVDLGVQDQEIPDIDMELIIPEECSQENLTDLYRTYVEPFVSGQVPSSCSQCHLTGVDISLYAQDNACDTMACMIDRGIVNLDQPEESALLQQISLGDPASSVFNIEVERRAMELWVQWSATCHQWVCGTIESGCSQGTGALTTGVLPQGDCSEEILLASFWDAFVVHQQRCNDCHSSFNPEFGSHFECREDTDCVENELCSLGRCRKNEHVATPFLEGLAEANDWNNPEHRRLANNAMYTMLTMDVIDSQEMLNSRLLTKPLPEGFMLSAIYGAHEPVLDIPEGLGRGVQHGGDTKFTLNCGAERCVLDCREDTVCVHDEECGTLQCLDGFCRAENSVCDITYVRFLSFLQTLDRCR